MMVEVAIKTLAIQLLKLHDTQAHGGAWDSQATCPTMDTVITTPGPNIVTTSSVEDTAAVTSTKHPRNTSSVRISMATDAPVQDSNPSWQRGVEGITTRETFQPARPRSPTGLTWPQPSPGTTSRTCRGRPRETTPGRTALQ